MSATDFASFAERAWAETQARYYMESHDKSRRRSTVCGDALWNKIYEEVCEEFRRASRNPVNPVNPV